ncbi:E3 ubiquitin-protein ligase TRIM45-like [Saccostrea echinata]|uniref:E3 ubiquitin-protein ligase TRIM45-like n=1 Tax=Saccostrea echinata TaxID=191078 RepID=UPI002A834AE1|nr:E3 ubiquitin-protein ligase TRIM45-like [Saccostrea echinata]
MDTPSTLTQEVITCEICDNPAQQFYNRYHVVLCGGCIRYHIESLKSQTHSIVSYHNRKEQNILPSCLLHSNQRCEGHCQQCDVPVCFRCLTGPHCGHTVIDTTEALEKKEEIKRESEEMKSIISFFLRHGAGYLKIYEEHKHNKLRKTTVYAPKFCAEIRTNN